MSLPYHPEIGTIVICDFNGVPPEMTKRRPAVIISPRLRNRDNLCTVVPLSTTSPRKIMPYHYKLYTSPPLPTPYEALFHWVKADMLATVSLKRLRLPFRKKQNDMKREYDVRVVEQSDLIKIHQCILHAIGLSKLTNFL